LLSVRRGFDFRADPWTPTVIMVGSDFSAGCLKPTALSEAEQIHISPGQPRWPMKSHAILSAAADVVAVDRLLCSHHYHRGRFLPLFTLSGCRRQHLSGRWRGPMPMRSRAACSRTFTITPAIGVRSILPSHMRENPIPAIMALLASALCSGVLNWAVEKPETGDGPGPRGLGAHDACVFGRLPRLEFLPKLERGQSLDPGANPCLRRSRCRRVMPMSTRYAR